MECNDPQALFFLVLIFPTARRPGGGAAAAGHIQIPRNRKRRRWWNGLDQRHCHGLGTHWNDGSDQSTGGMGGELRAQREREYMSDTRPARIPIDSNSSGLSPFLSSSPSSRFIQLGRWILFVNTVTHLRNQTGTHDDYRRRWKGQIRRRCGAYGGGPVEGSAPWTFAIAVSLSQKLYWIFVD